MKQIKTLLKEIGSSLLSICSSWENSDDRIRSISPIRTHSRRNESASLAHSYPLHSLLFPSKIPWSILIMKPSHFQTPRTLAECNFQTGYGKGEEKMDPEEKAYMWCLGIIAVAFAAILVIWG